MACQLCGKKISLWKRFSDNRYCSEEHRGEHARQQEQAALARLMHRPGPAKLTPSPQPASAASAVPLVEPAAMIAEPISAPRVAVPAGVATAEPFDAGFLLVCPEPAVRTAAARLGREAVRFPASLALARRRRQWSIDGLMGRSTQSLPVSRLISPSARDWAATARLEPGTLAWRPSRPMAGTQPASALALRPSGWLECGLVSDASSLTARTDANGYRGGLTVARLQKGAGLRSPSLSPGSSHSLRWNPAGYALLPRSPQAQNLRSRLQPALPAPMQRDPVFLRSTNQWQAIIPEARAAQPGLRESGDAVFQPRHGRAERLAPAAPALRACLEPRPLLAPPARGEAAAQPPAGWRQSAGRLRMPSLGQAATLALPVAEGAGSWAPMDAPAALKTSTSAPLSATVIAAAPPSSPPPILRLAEALSPIRPAPAGPPQPMLDAGSPRALEVAPRYAAIELAPINPVLQPIESPPPSMTPIEAWPELSASNDLLAADIALTGPVLSTALPLEPDFTPGPVLAQADPLALTHDLQAIDTAVGRSAQPAEPLAALQAPWWPGAAPQAAPVPSQLTLAGALAPNPAPAGEAEPAISSTTPKPFETRLAAVPTRLSALGPRLRPSAAPRATVIAPRDMQPAALPPEGELFLQAPEALQESAPLPAPRESQVRALLSRKTGGLARLWRQFLDLWQAAPILARGLAVVVPLLVPTLAFTRISSQPPPAAWMAVERSIRSRATVDLEDDFRAGLSFWEGAGDWFNTWSYDRSSFVLPGKIALYRPTVELTDYRMEFLGQIEKKSLGFAFRGRDPKNYYAVQIRIHAAPLPTATVVRYAMVDGQEQNRSELPLPLTIQSDTMYRVLVTVEGNHFTITVNGQMVDSWADWRLKSGGVGFFNEKGAVSRLRWVRVIHQDDFLGWVCSQFSPKTADRRASGEQPGERQPGENHD